RFMTMLDELSNSTRTLGATAEADNTGPLSGVKAWAGKAQANPRPSPASTPHRGCASNPCESIDTLQNCPGGALVADHRDAIQRAWRRSGQVGRDRAVTQPHYPVPDRHAVTGHRSGNRQPVRAGRR